MGYCKGKIDYTQVFGAKVVRLARFERATFGSGVQRSSLPTLAESRSVTKTG